MANLTSYQLSDKAGMMSRDEVDLLKACTKKLSGLSLLCPIVVNIGAGAGTSALAILEECPDCFIFSIDKRPVPAEAKALRAAGIDDRRIVRILGDSARAGKYWPYMAHLIFVDGSHTEAGLLADIEVWKPRVIAGGFMLFHDYDHRNLPHMKPLIDEAMKDWERVGQARFLVGFRNEGGLPKK